MLIIRTFILSIFAITLSSAWVFTAWNGVGCGEVPQNAEILQSIEGEGTRKCTNFDGDDKSFSFWGQLDEDEDAVIWAYHQPDCTGRRRRVRDECQNPLTRFPCIRSWEVVKR